jgi:hypothetical protein
MSDTAAEQDRDDAIISRQLHEIQRLHALLERCQTILGNMALETEGRGPLSLAPRWPINHEPLRHDARNLLPEIKAALAAWQLSR